jgi:hypothetical protein
MAWGKCAYLCGICCTATQEKIFKRHSWKSQIFGNCIKHFCHSWVKMISDGNMKFAINTDSTDILKSKRSLPGDTA